jgi:hypothetical protein
VRVASNDPDTPVITLQVTAEIEVLLGFQPQSLMLGDLSPGQTLTRSVALVGKLASGARLLAVEPPKHMAITMKPRDENGKRMVDLQIEVSKDVPPNRMLGGAARFTTSQPEASPLTLHLRGNVLGRIRATPQRVVVRRQNANDTATLQFEVAGRDGVEFNVLSVADDGKVVQPKVEPIERGHRYRVRAEVPGDPKRPRVAGTVTVKTNDAEVPVLRVPYSIVTAAVRKAPVRPSGLQRPPPAKERSQRE